MNSPGRRSVVPHTSSAVENRRSSLIAVRIPNRSIEGRKKKEKRIGQGEKKMKQIERQGICIIKLINILLDS